MYYVLQASTYMYATELVENKHVYMYVHMYMYMYMTCRLSTGLYSTVHQRHLHSGWYCFMKEANDWILEKTALTCTYMYVAALLMFNEYPISTNMSTHVQTHTVLCRVHMACTCT